jgi:hypothetical protein
MNKKLILLTKYINKNSMNINNKTMDIDKLNNKVIIHYKCTNLAKAPDEIFKIQSKYQDSNTIYYLVYNNKKSLFDLINKHSNESVIVHFHNKIIDLNTINKKINLKTIIQYHSEPIKVQLNVKTNIKLVLNQYHCLLKEYENCHIVRNFFSYDKLIHFNKKIKIGYYPSIIKEQNIYYDKGYNETKKILDKIKSKFNEIEIEIMYNISYDECINRKSSCHITIDECKTGSFHKSTIEGIMTGSIVFVYISPELEKKHLELYNKNLPVVNTPINLLEEELENYIILGKEKLEEIAIENRNEFISYWNDKIIYDEFYNIYQKL